MAKGVPITPKSGAGRLLLDSPRGKDSKELKRPATTPYTRLGLRHLHPKELGRVHWAVGVFDFNDTVDKIHN